jgi:hypothetical protein
MESAFFIFRGTEKEEAMKNMNSELFGNVETANKRGRGRKKHGGKRR